MGGKSTKQKQWDHIDNNKNSMVEIRKSPNRPRGQNGSFLGQTIADTLPPPGAEVDQSKTAADGLDGAPSLKRGSSKRSSWRRGSSAFSKFGNSIR